MIKVCITDYPLYILASKTSEIGSKSLPNNVFFIEGGNRGHGRFGVAFYMETENDARKEREVKM